MSLNKPITLHLKGDSLPANVGDNLLNALLKQCIPLPHNCRAGSCRSCEILDVNTEQVILACQTILSTDMALDYVSSIPKVPMQLHKKIVNESVSSNRNTLIFIGTFTHYFLQPIHLYKKNIKAEKQLVLTTRVLSDSNDLLAIDISGNVSGADGIPLNKEEWFIQDASADSLTPYSINDLPLDSAPLYIIISDNQVIVLEAVLGKLLIGLRDLTQANIVISVFFSVTLDPSSITRRKDEINSVVEQHSKVAISFFNVESEQPIPNQEELSSWSAQQKRNNFMFLRASFVVIADLVTCRHVTQEFDLIGVSKERIHLFDL